MNIHRRRLLPLLLLLPACVQPPSRGDAGPASAESGETGEVAEEADEGSEDEDEDASAALPPSPFSLGGFGAFSSLLSGGLEKPGPYDEPHESEGFDKGEPHLVVMELSGPVAELESFSMFSTTTATPMRTLTDRFAELAEDEKVEGLVLRVDDLGLNMAQAEELRGHLLAYRGDGAHELHCHIEGASNSTYYLLTACDSIGLAPLGGINIPGPAAMPVHLKGALDRLGLQADFVHVGAYKGAAEPLTRTSPSAEMRETLQAIIDRSYDTMVTAMAEGRKDLDADGAKARIDEALYMGDKAVEAGLVDEVGTFAAFRDAKAGDRGWKVAKKPKSDPFGDPLALQRFLGVFPPKRPMVKHVAVVYAVGNIVDGDGGGALGAREQIASGTLVPALRALARDEQVAGVVLRVDSGGGSALASEQIWHATREIAEKKPLVVSMGSVAASGGYYISAGAERIFALENTLTGSIGVVGGKSVRGDGLGRPGIQTSTLEKGKRSTMWSSMEPWNAEDKAAVLAMMEDTYEVFLSRVAAGRNKDRDQVHAVAQGRVWTGMDAKAEGLVDEIGGLDAALAYAHEKAGIDPSVGLQVYPGEPTLKDLLGSFGQVQAPVGARVPLGFQTLLDQALVLADPATAAAIRDALGTVFALRDSRVWAVDMTRPPR